MLQGTPNIFKFDSIVQETFIQDSSLKINEIKKKLTTVILQLVQLFQYTLIYKLYVVARFLDKKLHRVDKATVCL